MIGLAAAASVFGGGLDIPARAADRAGAAGDLSRSRRRGDRRARRALWAAGRTSTPCPAYVPAAFVAIEDRRFYEHGGVDPMGIARAVVSDLVQGRAAQGASTITQQLARNLYLSSERTLERKGEEMLLALELERTYRKKQILGLYLSRVYFGAGAYGLEAASRRFFDKPAQTADRARGGDAGGADEIAGQLQPDRPAGGFGAADRAGARRHGRERRDHRRPARAMPSPRARRYGATIRSARRSISSTGWRPAAPPIAPQSAAATPGRHHPRRPPWRPPPAKPLRAAIDRHAGQGVQQGALVALDGEGAVRAMVGGAILRRRPLQPRGRRPSAGRLGVEAVRLSGGDGGRPHARQPWRSTSR